jgi:hypothetical protein
MKLIILLAAARGFQCVQAAAFGIAHCLRGVAALISFTGQAVTRMTLMNSPQHNCLRLYSLMWFFITHSVNKINQLSAYQCQLFVMWRNKHADSLEGPYVIAK